MHGPRSAPAADVGGSRGQPCRELSREFLADDPAAADPKEIARCQSFMRQLEPSPLRESSALEMK